MERFWESARSVRRGLLRFVLGVSTLLVGVAAETASATPQQSQRWGAPPGAASRSGCGDQKWPATIHFQVENGALGERVLDCRADRTDRRIDILLNERDYVEQFWRKTMLLLPPSVTERIGELIITASHPSRGDNSLAYVSLANADATHFNLGISLSGFERPSRWRSQRMLHSVIHEAAHIIVGNDSQSVRKNETRPCATYQVWPTFCSLPQAIIERYRLAFWPNGVADGPSHGYVTGYARSQMEEDFAETFAFWVLKPERLSVSPILRDKAAFLENIPELTEIRGYIVARLEQ